jgi:hypothetical protein
MLCNTAVRRLVVGLLVIAPVALTGCGGSSSKTAASAATPGSSSTPAGSSGAASSAARSPLVSAGASSAASSRAASSGAASTAPPATGAKAVFITKADAVCTATIAKVAALPVPTGEADYTNLLANLVGTESLFQTYIAQIKVLVAQSPDKAELTSKWVSLEDADYDSAQPVLAELITALKAKDQAAVQTAGNKLDGGADHTAEMATFLKSYGLTECAKLESSDGS